MTSLEKTRAKRVRRAEQELGLPEGHYNLGEKFVRIWVEFYPRERWLVCDCERPLGSDIPGTTRTLDSEALSKLETWL